MGDVLLCGLCRNGSGFRVVLDLGLQPLAEREGDERYPLKVIECRLCGLAQLSYIVDQREMFPVNHPYSSRHSKALYRNFCNLVDSIRPRLAKDDLVVDIGANDGTLLNRYGPGVRRVAVEPTGQIRHVQNAVKYPEFFTARTARKILDKQGPAKVITATNVLAHVPDPHDFMDGIAILLEPADGVFVTENHHWLSVARDLQIDTVYHEHLRYWTPNTLGALLTEHGFVIEESRAVDTHGGSFRTYAVRNPSSDLFVAGRYALDELHRAIEHAAAAGPVYGVGATTRATPLIFGAQIADFIDCVVELPGSDKIGTNMPGTRIPVKDETFLFQDQPSYALLFSWHLASDIVPALRKRGFRGKFIIPLPVARILSDDEFA